MRRQAAAFLALTLGGLVLPPAAPAAAAAPPDGPGGEPGPAPAVGPGIPGDQAMLDRVAVRFYAPETGGTRRPRFITERTLAFEARMVAMGEEGTAPDAPVEERHLRLAMERHVAEELLSVLGVEGGKATFDLTGLADDTRAELARRVGGEAQIARAADVEHLDPEEVHAFFLRHARASYYLDRQNPGLLSPPDEQVRELYRSSAHPFKNLRFEDARKDLARWFVAERVKAAEATFLQSARTRVKILVVGRT